MLLSNIQIAKAHQIFYVETQRKSNSLDDFGQFLFAVIPDNVGVSSEEKKMAKRKVLK